MKPRRCVCGKCDYCKSRHYYELNQTRILNRRKFYGEVAREKDAFLRTVSPDVLIRYVLEGEELE